MKEEVTASDLFKQLQDVLENEHSNESPDNDNDSAEEEGDEVEGEGEEEEDPKLKAKKERDERSIFLQNVDHAAREEDIKTHFEDCGTINSVTIPRNKHNGRSRGIAYVEFLDKDAVELALKKTKVIINGRPLTITTKRTNIPSFKRGVKPQFKKKPRFKGRGRGYRGRGRGRGRH
mmetsp:Transcript_10980/g.16152  ORF Transcript_10980/g.16152 Transcript_10980/m.16152 type:complete len:176 (+) Transcript_10980:866-1393(+)